MDFSSALATGGNSAVTSVTTNVSAILPTVLIIVGGLLGLKVGIGFLRKPR